MDFINTVHDRFNEPLNDYLVKISDVIVWAHRAGVVDKIGKEQFDKLASNRPQEANDFFEGAVTLRELLHRMFLNIAQGKKIDQNDLGKFNSALSDYFSKLNLKQEDHLIEETWQFPADSFYLIKASIIKDAYELLLDNKPNRIKECPNCGWLFVDSSKNGKRRWCSMETCGSQVKALGWYHRQKNT